MTTGGLHEIVYVSECRLPAEPHTQQAELDRIARLAAARNEPDQITGALLVGRTHFAQVLEGQLERLKATFARIEKDRRHANVAVIRIAPIAVRNWPNWSMSLMKLGDIAEGQARRAALDPSELSSLKELEHLVAERDQQWSTHG